jgi:ketol-acid reductoisomerase
VGGADAEADLSLIRSRRVAVIGDYPGYGHAHALGLRDCGVDVLVGLPMKDGGQAGASAAAEATDDGLPVLEPASAAAAADVVVLLSPDDIVRQRFEADIAPNLAEGDALLFRSGVNVGFGLVDPPAAVDVALVSALTPAPVMRRQFVDGRGVPCLVAVAADASGQAWPLALSYARAVSGSGAGVISTTFVEQAQAALFGEQAVRLGGVPALVRAGFETLTGAGCAPEVAYVACLHELRDAVDRMHRAGLAGLYDSVPEAAAYGGLTRGPRVIGDAVHDELRKLLTEIADGSFAREWIAEDAAGRPDLRHLAAQAAAHPLERSGRYVRSLLPPT